MLSISFLSFSCSASYTALSGLPEEAEAPLSRCSLVVGGTGTGEVREEMPLVALLPFDLEVELPVEEVALTFGAGMIISKRGSK